MRISREYSAGGLVTKGGRVLLVRVRNLQGRILWTFPKGHLEGGERPRKAAVREVEEETGWRCRVRSPLLLIRYHFTHRGRRVYKRVRWYWMDPEARPGRPDPEEVLACRWMTFSRARAGLRYIGDLRLLKMVEKRCRSNGRRS